MNKIKLTEDTYTIELGNTWVLMSIETGGHIIRGFSDKAYTVDDVESMSYMVTATFDGHGYVDRDAPAVRVWR